MNVYQYEDECESLIEMLKFATCSGKNSTKNNLLGRQIFYDKSQTVLAFLRCFVKTAFCNIAFEQLPLSLLLQNLTYAKIICVYPSSVENV